MKTTQFNCRLSAETLNTIAALAATLECSQADVIRQSVRLLAQRWAQKKIPKKKKNPLDTV